MKVSLVVTQGVHAGKVIPITVSSFLIGRDPQCQLRPASPAVSKQHCGITVRNGKVFIRDCGSTNGTFVNGEQIAAERELKSGDRLRVGPLEFDLKIEAGAPAAPARKVVKSAAERSAATGSTEAAPPPGRSQAETDTVEQARASSTTIIEAPGSGLENDPDHAAALLLGLDDDSSSSSPSAQDNTASDSTVVMEVPALGGSKPAAPKKEEKKSHQDSSAAAAEALSRYMRRPRT